MRLIFVLYIIFVIAGYIIVKSLNDNILAQAAFTIACFAVYCVGYIAGKKDSK